MTEHLALKAQAQVDHKPRLSKTGLLGVGIASAALLLVATFGLPFSDTNEDKTLLTHPDVFLQDSEPVA